MTTEQLVDRLASHRTMGGAPREELTWIAEHCTFRELKPGDVLASQSEIVKGLYILLSGHLSIYIDRGAGRRKAMEWTGGDVTGMLPYSRTRMPPGDTIVDTSIELLDLPRERLPDLIRTCPESTAILVHAMIDRARGFKSTDLRDEKTISLGKLAAGLAHELNNPASAAVRDTKSLAGALTDAEDAARALGAACLSAEKLAAVDAVRDFCMGAMTHRMQTGLALADREDAIAEWLQNHGSNLASAEEIARTPLTIEDLDRLASTLPGDALDAALRWIAGGCAVRSLVVDIERATTRIHALVAAVKGFTHMDRAHDVEPVDLPRGLADTVALLEGKAKGKSVAISLSMDPDLTAIRGISVEINQIWMNLVDNAIDAAPAHGHVIVTATRDGDRVAVSVLDDGAGIPPEIQERIFDPFFTTKPIGEGTGLGLDIVRRIVQWHNGDIDVTSVPGRTEFRVRLPGSGG